jgi:hypothetical protein
MPPLPPLPLPLEPPELPEPVGPQPASSAIKHEVQKLNTCERRM